MIQQHCFPQLVQIFDAMHDANPNIEADGQEEDVDSDDEIEDVENTLGALPGIRGEAKVAMLTDDILRQVETLVASPAPLPTKVTGEGMVSPETDTHCRLAQKPIRRQTFIFSATLTLPYTATSLNATKQSRKRSKLGFDGAIGEILSKARASGETKIIDLTSKSSHSIGATSIGKESSSKAYQGLCIPEGLKLEQIKCTQRHKDLHLYAYLATTVQGASGPCLIFCNSISGVRRVGATMQKLGISVRMLHAHMQQVSICGKKYRFKALTKILDSRTVYGSK